MYIYICKYTEYRYIYTEYKYFGLPKISPES